MRHLDLFSGIGGFSLSALWVWGDEHKIVSFVEIDPFCQKVLKKHWPDVPIISDIRSLTWEKLVQSVEYQRKLKTRKRADIYHTANRVKQNGNRTGGKKIENGGGQQIGRGVKKEKTKSLSTMEENVFVVENQQESSSPLTTSSITETQKEENINHTHGKSQLKGGCQMTTKSCVTIAITQDQTTEPVHIKERVKIDLLTAGTPCQPASCAGKRRGAEDDRWLWPEAIRVVREFKPKWIIFENVTGLITLNNGLEFDKVLSQLEAEGYETESFIIPACAVDAPHRRDRVWIVANRKSTGLERHKCLARRKGVEAGATLEPENIHDPNSIGQHDDRGGHGSSEICRERREKTELSGCEDVADPFSIIERRYGVGWPSGVSWWEREPAEAIQNAWENRRKEDGLPEFKSELGRVAYGISNRVDRLRALGNAIVPQCVMPIMAAIKEVEGKLSNG